GIGLHEGTRRSYEQFLAAHGCSVGADGWQFHRGPRGAQALARLHSRIFPARGSRIRIADLGDAFPPTQILCEAAYVERREEIEDAFQEAQSTIQRLREQGDKSEGELRLLELSTYMQAWHESERLKIP